MRLRWRVLLVCLLPCYEVVSHQSTFAQTLQPVLDGETKAFAAICTGKGVDARAQPPVTIRPTQDASFACIEQILRELPKQTENVDLAALAHRQLWNAAEVMRARHAATGGEHPFIVPMLEAVRDNEAHQLRKEAWLALTLVRNIKLASVADFEALGGLAIDPDEDLESMDRVDVHPLLVERMIFYMSKLAEALIESTAIEQYEDVGTLAFNVSQLAQWTPAVQRLVLERQLGRRLIVSSEKPPTVQTSPLPTFAVSFTTELCAGRGGCQSFTTPVVSNGVSVGGGVKTWRDDSGGTSSHAEARLNHVGNQQFPFASVFTTAVTSYVRGGFRAGDTLGVTSAENQTSTVSYVLTATAEVPACTSIAGCSPVIQLHYHPAPWPPEFGAEETLTVSRNGTTIQSMKSMSSVNLDRTAGALQIKLVLKRIKSHIGACCEQTGTIHSAGVTLVEPHPDPAATLPTFSPPAVLPNPTEPGPSLLERALTTQFEGSTRDARFRWANNVGLAARARQLKTIPFAPIGEILIWPDVSDTQFDTRTSTLYAKLLLIRLLEERASSLLSAQERQSIRQAKAILSAQGRRLYLAQSESRQRELQTMRALVKPEAIDGIMALLIGGKGLVSLEALRDPGIVRELGSVVGADSSAELVSLLKKFEDAQTSNNLLAAVVALQEVRTQIDLLAASLDSEINLLAAEIRQLKEAAQP